MKRPLTARERDQLRSLKARFDDPRRPIKWRRRECESLARLGLAEHVHGVVYAITESGISEADTL